MTTHCVLLPLLALLPLNHPLCSIFCAFQDDCLEKAEDCLSRHLGNELDKLDFSQSSTSIAQKIISSSFKIKNEIMQLKNEYSVVQTFMSKPL